jgi:hypothetical protein
MSTYLIQTFHYDEDQPGQHTSHRDQGGQHIQYRYVTMIKINQVNILSIDISPQRRSTRSTYLI